MPERPRLIVLIGLPGAGKSTLAAHLAARLRLPVVNRDVIRAAQFPAGRFTDAEKRAARTAVWAAVRAHAELGTGCIVDGMTFARAAQRRQAAALSRRLGLRYSPVWLDCPIDLACARVRTASQHLAGDRTPELVRRIATQFQPPRAGIRLDARAAPATLARQVCIELRRTPARTRGGKPAGRKPGPARRSGKV